jgi:hypothetical protein
MSHCMRSSVSRIKEKLLVNISAQVRIVVSFVTVLLAAGSSTQVARLAPTSARPVLQAPTPAGLPIEKLDHLQLRFRVAEAFAEIFTCGPFHVTQEELEKEVAAFPEIRRDAELADWIKHRLGLTGKVQLSDQEKRSIYWQYRRLRSIVLERSGDAYNFRVRVMDRGKYVKPISHFLVSGLVDTDGRLWVQKRDPVFYPPCAR